MTRKHSIAILLLFLFAMQSSFVVAAKTAINKATVIIDGSGSYASKRNKAVARASRLLEDMAETKLKRWQKGKDFISIIVLDSMPEVLWTGTLDELKQVKSDFWTARFSSRQNLSGCTDVNKAFETALKQMTGDAAFTSKYMFVFSDMIHEPPLSTVSHCAKPKYSPAEGFPWDKLHHVSVNVFWTPPNQKLRWTRSIEEHGLQESFHVFAGDSAEVEITPPPRPKRTISDEERDNIREKVSGFFSGLVTWGIGSIAGFILLLLITTFIVRTVRRFKQG